MLGIKQIVAPGNCILLLFRIPYILYLLSTYISATSVFFNFTWKCKEHRIIFSPLFIPCPLMPTVLILRRGLSFSAATLQPMRRVLVLVVTWTNDKRKKNCTSLSLSHFTVELGSKQKDSIKYVSQEQPVKIC